MMNSLIKNKRKDIFQKCENFGVDKLWVFGSATTLDFGLESDFDFLVNFNKMKIEDYAENYFLLAESLEQILERSVDLVTVNSLSNPFFIDEVNKSKELVYDRQDQKIPA